MEEMQMSNKIDIKNADIMKMNTHRNFTESLVFNALISVWLMLFFFSLSCHSFSDRSAKTYGRDRLNMPAFSNIYHWHCHSILISLNAATRCVPKVR